LRIQPELDETMAQIDAVDLAFVVDTTGSMGRLIAAAQRQRVAMLDALAQAADVALQLPMVEYRDHPPQDALPFRVQPFSDDRKRANVVIKGLVATGGGDGPESVLYGVLAACRALAWRRRAATGSRWAVLAARPLSSTFERGVAMA
jgi:hypothetical protein